MTRMLATLLLLWVAAGAAHAEEAILSFHADVRVHADSTLQVTETIRVRAEGKRIRRGIYRDFPTDYEDRYGNDYNVGFKVLSVRRGGEREAWHTERRHNGVRVYMGRSDHFLQPGEYTYKLTYRTTRQIGFFDDHDELYWNVTGNGWSFPIRQASATVTLPDGVPAKAMQLTGFTGRQGSTEQALDQRITGPSRAAFHSTRTLGPGEGLTVVVSWPKGYVNKPGPLDQAALYARDNRPAVVALAGLLLLFAVYGVFWHAAGRDPAPGVVVPRYQPPEGVSPAAARYLQRMGFDDRAFAAALIDMAVKGFLTIDKSGGDYILNLADKNRVNLLSPGEKAVAEALFGKRYWKGRVVLEQENHADISAARKALREALKGEHLGAHFKSNALLFSAGLLGSLALLAYVVTAVAGLPWQLSITAVVFMGAIALGAGQRRQFWLVGLVGIVAVLAAGFVGGMLVPALLVAAILGMNLLFQHLLKAPTRPGRRLMDRIDGFRQYLSVAEREELNWENPPRKTTDLYEIYLPYALALDVEQPWSEKFARVLAAAGTDTGGYRPHWYHGADWHGRDFGRFASQIGSSLSSSISSSATAPGSTSGVGGFSGGGGGGGGGGGW